VIAGIFVGGRGSRMGGVPKGLLEVDGVPLVVRTARLLERLGHRPRLVGLHEAYAVLPWPVIDDDPATRGPLAGLIALLEHADERYVLALAGDMPAISEDLVQALVHAPHALVVAPRRVFWEPLVARYDAAVLPIARAGTPKLQSLLDRAGAVPLAWDGPLVDWDEPGDIA